MNITTNTITMIMKVSESLFGLRRSPHSLRCKPSIDIEANTCRWGRDGDDGEDHYADDHDGDVGDDGDDDGLWWMQHGDEYVLSPVQTGHLYWGKHLQVMIVTKTMITIITIIIIIMMMMMKITTGDARLVERLAHTWTLVLELAPMSLSLFLCLRSNSLHDDDQRDGDDEQNPPSSAGHRDGLLDSFRLRSQSPGR